MTSPDSTATTAPLLRRWLPILLIAAMITLGGGVFLATRLRDAPPVDPATAAASARSTPTQVAPAIATITPARVNTRVAATPTAIPTPVASPVQAAATPQGQAQALATAETLTARSQIVFGPKSGALMHRPDDGALPTLQTELELSNFIAEARFDNPYAATEGEWSYGLGFRETGRNDQYRLSIASNRQWALRLVLGEGRPSLVIGSGTLENLNLGSGERNTLTLFVEDTIALLFVNNTYIASLDVSASRAKGDVWIATGMFVGHEVAGAATLYTDFVVRALP